MKNTLITILVLLLLGGCSRSQEYENLEVLCRVWGFVKYHHPVFADSTVDVDKELFDLLPKIQHADKQKRNALLLEWTDRLGKFKINKAYYDTIEYKPNIQLQADLTWIGDSDILGTALCNRLKALRYAERSDNRYCKYDTIPLDCSNEKAYRSQRNYSSFQLRMLTLFRCWNFIEYFCPYRDLTDKDWGEVLSEYIPRMTKVKDASAYRYLFCEFTTEISDSHGSADIAFLFGNRHIPIDLQEVEGKLVVSPTGRYTNLGYTKLLPGDEIVEVNGRSVQQIKKRVRKYCPSSTEAHWNSAWASFSRVVREKEVTIVYKRENVTHKTQCATLSGTEVYALSKAEGGTPSRSYIKDSIFYLHMGTYSKDNAIAIGNDLKKSKAIIADFRDHTNPKTISIIWYCLLPWETHVTTVSLPKKRLPGYFYTRKEWNV